MDRLFGDMFEGFEGNGGGQVPNNRLPVDIQQTENGYVVRAPVAGFKPEEVEVTFSDGVLAINAQHREEKTEKQKKGQYIRREVSYGNYQRQIMLPGDVQSDKITATFDNGILTIEVPRTRRPEPRKIQVKGGEQKPQSRELTGSGASRR
jgi:HSP20 family protein